MFERLRTKRRNREIIDRVYDAIVERARRPALYIEGGLPDTVLGRYEALGIEVLLLLDRCRAEPELAAFAQDIVDRFMRDLDHSLREIGIGYQGIPRRMRKLANRFYSRVSHYQAPLADGDRSALAAALRARAYDGASPPEGGPIFLAAHMIETTNAYRQVRTQTLLSGRLDEPRENDR